MSRKHQRRHEHCEDGPKLPNEIAIFVTLSPIVIEHRYPPPLPQRKLRFVTEIGKQTDLPEEIKKELEETMLTRKFKADEFLKVEVVSTEPGGQPAPIDTDEPIRVLVEEGTIRGVVSPALEADGKRYIYFVPSSAGVNTGRVVVDGTPGEGQTFIEEPFNLTIDPAVTPATNVGLTEVSVSKQTALPDAIKQILAETGPA